MIKRGFEVSLAGWLRLNIKGNSLRGNKMSEELKKQLLSVFQRVVLSILATVMIIVEEKQGFRLEKWVGSLHGVEGMLLSFADGSTKEYPLCSFVT